MKSLSVLLAALVFSASAALAQTVLPSGAVAPAGAVLAPSGVLVTPGTVPGSQPLATPGLRDGGRPRGRRRDQEVPGLSHRDERRLQKMGKVKTKADGTVKVPAN